jgi:hypothetical protein
MIDRCAFDAAKGVRAPQNWLGGRRTLDVADHPLSRSDDDRRRDWLHEAKGGIMRHRDCKATLEPHQSSSSKDIAGPLSVLTRIGRRQDHRTIGVTDMPANRADPAAVRARQVISPCDASARLNRITRERPVECCTSVCIKTMMCSGDRKGIPIGAERA